MQTREETKAMRKRASGTAVGGGADHTGLAPGKARTEACFGKPAFGVGSDRLSGGPHEAVLPAAEIGACAHHGPWFVTDRTTSDGRLVVLNVQLFYRLAKTRGGTSLDAANLRRVFDAWDIEKVVERERERHQDDVCERLVTTIDPDHVRARIDPTTHGQAGQRVLELWSDRDPDASPFAADCNYVWGLTASCEPDHPLASEPEAARAPAGKYVRTFHYVGTASQLARDNQNTGGGVGCLAHRTLVHTRCAIGDLAQLTASMEAFLFDPGTKWGPPTTSDLGVLVWPLKPVELPTGHPLAMSRPTPESRPKLFARYKSPLFPSAMFEESLYQMGFRADGRLAASKVRSSDYGNGGLNRHIGPVRGEPDDDDDDDEGWTLEAREAKRAWARELVRTNIATHPLSRMQACTALQGAKLLASDRGISITAMIAELAKLTEDPSDSGVANGRQLANVRANDSVFTSTFTIHGLNAIAQRNGVTPTPTSAELVTMALKALDDMHLLCGLEFRVECPESIHDPALLDALLATSEAMERARLLVRWLLPDADADDDVDRSESARYALLREGVSDGMTLVRSLLTKLSSQELATHEQRVQRADAWGKHLPLPRSVGKDVYDLLRVYGSEEASLALFCTSESTLCNEWRRMNGVSSGLSEVKKCCKADPRRRFGTNDPSCYIRYLRPASSEEMETLPLDPVLSELARDAISSTRIDADAPAARTECSECRLRLGVIR